MTHTATTKAVLDLFKSVKPGLRNSFILFFIKIGLGQKL